MSEELQLWAVKSQLDDSYYTGEFDRSVPPDYYVGSFDKAMIFTDSKVAQSFAEDVYGIVVPVHKVIAKTAVEAALQEVHNLIDESQFSSFNTSRFHKVIDKMEEKL